MAQSEGISQFTENPEMKKTMTYLLEVETLAQDIMTERDIQLQLADQQNKFRECYRALQQTEAKTASINFGGVYIDFSTPKCVSIIKEELDKVTEEVEEKWKTIKTMLQKMRDLEHQPNIVGFNLKPMTGAEAKAIYKAFGID